MPNEFVARNGIIALKDSQITGSLNVSGGITGSIASASYALTASFAGSASWADFAEIGVAAGGSTNFNVSQLVFSNANGVSFGLDNNTITATYTPGAAGPAKSYFEHIPVIQGSTSATVGASSNYVQPFILPYDVSVSYMRMPITVSFGQTSVASTANTSYGADFQQTFWANIYSLGTGANSRSLQQLAQASATMRYVVTGSIGAASNNQTVTQAVTIPAEGGYNNTFTTQYNTTLTSGTIVSSLLTLFNGARGLDLLFATSLPAGAYWMAIQRSTAVTTAGATAMTAASINYSQIFASQISNNFNLWGANATAGSNGIELGVGVWTTNTLGRTSNSLAMSQISTIGNNPRIPFQLIRQA